MRAETAAMIMMSGSADLEDITITENGEYESVDHDGFNVVTVEVETYWDEYQQALADIADLEDELEACHDCRDEVVAALQQYDPDYDPDEGECPADKVTEVVDKVGELEDELEQCHDCKDAVVAAMQAIDPDYVLPASGCPDDIPQKAYEKGEEDAPDKYTFDPEVPIDNISSIVAGEPIGTPNSNYYLDVYVHAYQWGVTPPETYEGRTVYATSETGELSAQICADVVDGSGTVIRHYITAQGYSVFPSLNGYAQITNYTISNDVITIDMFVYRNDGWSSTKTATFTDSLFADFATGPYTVRKK